MLTSVENMLIKPVRTAFRSPWQNGGAERWVGSCRRDMMDHVLVLNERHARRLLAEYLKYYHEDRTHYALAKEPPLCRPVTERPSPQIEGRWDSQSGWLASPVRMVPSRLSLG